MDKLQDVPGLAARTRQGIRHALPVLGVQIGFGLAGLAAVYGLVRILPRGADARGQALISVHERGLEASLEAFDFAQARYHAAQLEILKPDVVTHGIALKSELIHTVFTQPSLLHSPEGVAQLQAQLLTVERCFVGFEDPDLLTIRAHVQWQAGRTRRDEYDAAELVARALEQSPSDAPGAGARRFLLRGLAQNYLLDFLHAPYAPAASAAPWLARARETMRTLASAPELPALQSVIAYDRLARTLDRASSPAYLAMLRAHADYLRTRVALRGAPEPAVDAASKSLGPAQHAVWETKVARRDQAMKVVEAWKAFDQGLAGDPLLAGSSTALASFTLDDAVLSHALWFTTHPDATTLAPLLTARAASPPAPARGKRGAPVAPAALFPLTASAIERLELAPLRVVWMRRLGGAIGSQSRDILDMQEYERFRQFEARTRAFEDSLVEYWKARGERTPADFRLALAAAVTAAAAGIRDADPSGEAMVSYSQVLLKQADTLRAGAAAGPNDPETDEARKQIGALDSARLFRLL